MTYKTIQRILTAAALLIGAAMLTPADTPKGGPLNEKEADTMALLISQQEVFNLRLTMVQRQQQDVLVGACMRYGIPSDKCDYEQTKTGLIVKQKAEPPKAEAPKEIHQ